MQHSSEETSQRWRAIGDTASDLTCPGIEPHIFRTDSDLATTIPTYVVLFWTRLFPRDRGDKVKSSLYSRRYTEASNEWRGSSPRLSAWATQLLKTSQQWRVVGQFVSDLTDLGIERQTFRANSDVTTTPTGQ